MPITHIRPDMDDPTFRALAVIECPEAFGDPGTPSLVFRMGRAPVAVVPDGRPQGSRVHAHGVHDDHPAGLEKGAVRPLMHDVDQLSTDLVKE